MAVTVPRLSLIDQTLDRFEESGIDPMSVGVVQGDHPCSRPSAPIQVCSLQTVMRRGRPNVDSVLVDECHLKSKEIDAWMDEEPGKIFVGLSATPWARGMAERWDHLIVPATIKELTDEGWLSPARTFAPYHPDLSGVTVQMGDYHEGQLAKRMGAREIVANVVETWLAKAERRPTLLFAVDRAHADQLHNEFEAAGVASAYVDAFTERDERISIGRRLNSGLIEVICSVGTMSHGIDLDVRCIVLARPTKSEMLYVQMIGRGLRMANGKKDVHPRPQRHRAQPWAGERYHARSAPPRQAQGCDRDRA